MTLRESIKARFDKLNKMMDSDDYVSPDMLDQAMGVIYCQSRYIDQLEEQHKTLIGLHNKVYKEVVKTYKIINRD